MSRYLICEAHCKLPADNRKSEYVKKSVNWSTQDCNNALRMAIMHKLHCGVVVQKETFKRIDMG